MTDYEFRTMLGQLSTIQQAATWWLVFRRWLFRPRQRIWEITELYPVVYVLG